MIVTGGSRGIGAATARLGAQRGYAVCVNYRSDRPAAEKLAKEIGGIAVAADVSHEDDVIRLFRQTEQSLGRMTALVNNAGVVDLRSRVEDMSAQRLQRMFAVNVIGSFLCAREAVKRMSKRHGGQGGAIVNLSSAAARLGSPGDYVDYAASKGAIDTFTVGLAKEVAADGIRVNAVRPGVIHTGIHAQSGKSKLALELAARRPIEIVSVDSALVYRGMDVGTAKPSITERAAVPHQLIDIVDPDHSYSTGRWRSDAIGAVMEIFQRERIPLLVGGTMLYYRALIAGLDSLPQADAAIRAEIDAEARLRGWPALHAELEKVDPRAAQRISPNDAQRLQRALEVWRLTRKPLSALQGAAQPDLPFQLKGFGLLPEREALHERIARRFDAMLRAGLVDEVKRLRGRYRLTAGMPGQRAGGYRPGRPN